MYSVLPGRNLPDLTFAAAMNGVAFEIISLFGLM